MDFKRQDASHTFLLDVKVEEQTGRSSVVGAEWTTAIQAPFAPRPVLFWIHPSISIFSVCAGWWHLLPSSWSGVLIDLRMAGQRIIWLHFRSRFLWLCMIYYTSHDSWNYFIAYLFIIVLNRKPFVPWALLALGGARIGSQRVGVFWPQTCRQR